MEVWKNIPGYEGIYQASTEGRIRSVDGKVTIRKDGSIRKWKSRIMSGRGNQNSGYRVNLWKDGVKTDFLVHRLVAITFLGFPPSDDYTVNHKDGNRFNNNIKNLEWMTRAENIRYGFRFGQYDNNKIPISIEMGKESYVFSSLSACSRALRRNTGYASMVIKSGETKLVDADGDAYEIVRVGKLKE